MTTNMFLNHLIHKECNYFTLECSRSIQHQVVFHDSHTCYLYQDIILRGSTMALVYILVIQLKPSCSNISKTKTIFLCCENSLTWFVSCRVDDNFGDLHTSTNRIWWKAHLYVNMNQPHWPTILLSWICQGNY